MNDDWKLDGNCWGIAPSNAAFWAFFPGDEKADSPRVREAYQEASQLCDDCPVQYECLDYAITNSMYFGMWGGKTPTQRRRITKRDWKRRRQAA